MMLRILSEYCVEQLIQVESGVHYNELPPTVLQPFVVINRNSPIVLSAPHGAKTFRFNESEVWHEEDEYTSGLALLLSDICQTSVITTTWKTSESDPNEHSEKQSTYKRSLRELREESDTRWFLDLHGTREDKPKIGLVDLGTNYCHTMDKIHIDTFKTLIEKNLGNNSVTERIQATQKNRLVNYCKDSLAICAVQIEMKPSVRTAYRRIDASMYRKPISDGGGPYNAPAKQVLGMMQALVDFIEYLKVCEE